MRKNLEIIARGLIYATFLVPLVVAPTSFIFPFIVPKILLFRTLVTFLLGAYVLLLIINWREYRPRLTPITITLLIFLGSFAISTFAGVDVYHSFWDNHERMLGLFTLSHYLIYYLAATAVLKTWTDWKWALRLFLLAGSVAMFIALLQWGDPTMLLNQGSDRTASTLGNAIYVGGYGLFLFFAALILFMKEKEIVWRWTEAILGVLAVLGLLLSKTRGSLLGLLFGIAVAIISYAILAKGRPRARLALGGFFVFGTVLLGALYLNREAPWVQAIPGVGRLVNSSFVGGTGTTRLIAWRIAIESWRERPLFGWGPNNFFYAFNQHYNPASLEHGYGETWFDNAHNIILNTLTVQGILGLAAYLLIFGVAAAVVWKNKEMRERNWHFTVLAPAFLLGHLLQNITVFENPTSYLYFMFWLAMINSSCSLKAAGEAVPNDLKINQNSIDKAGGDRAVGWGISSLTTALCLLLIFIFNIQPARANIKTLNALSEFGRDPILGMAAMREAASFSSPHIDDIRSDLTRTAVQVLGGAYQRLGTERTKEIISFCKEALQKNIELHPLDIRNYMTLAQLGQISYAATGDPRELLEADVSLTAALRYSPRRQQLIYMLSTMKAQLGRKNEALALAEQALDEDPLVGESYWRLGYLHYLLGDREKARGYINLAGQRGLVFDEQGQQVAAIIMAGASSTKP